MDERVMQFRVGASFLAALIFAGILLFLFGKMPTFIGHYEIKARFDDVGGISDRRAGADQRRVRRPRHRHPADRQR